MLAAQVIAHLDLAVNFPSGAGMQIAILGAGFHGGALLGWPLFKQIRRRAYLSYGSRAPEGNDPSIRLHENIGAAWRQGLFTLLLLTPVITLASLSWTWLLEQFGLSTAPQDLVTIFSQVDSLPVLFAMLFVACILAPINEELLFRGILFRHVRQSFGRWPAIFASSVPFAAMHGNWASFLPLMLLGAGFALAYERTGDIRVNITAHALFNLNTIVLILAGITT